MHQCRPVLLASALLASLLATGPALSSTAVADALPSDKTAQPGGSDPSNVYLSAVVGANARFSEGAHPGSASEYKIMYGWPGTGTSFTTVKVDGVPSDFGGSAGTFTTVPHELDALTNTAVWTAGGVATTQTIRLVTNPDTGRVDTAAITYTSRNTDDVSHSVGLRLMNDVDVNDNDGASFRLPSLGSLTTERDLTGTDIPDTFQVFADLSDTQHIAAARLSGAGATAPDRLVIGQWPGLVSTLWDYTTTPGLAITGDSAYAVFWNPVSLAPGASRTITTYYGLSDISVDLRPPLALGVSGPTTMSMYRNSYTPNPFTVTATVANVGTLPATGVTLTLNLPPGLRTTSPNPVVVGNLAPGGAERQVSWQVTAASRTDPRTLTYSVTGNGVNTASKTVSRTILLPAVGQCDEVLFVGVPGSGESDDAGHYGKTVDIIRSAFVSHLPRDVSHREVPLRYTAAPVDELTSWAIAKARTGGLYDNGGLDRYFASIEDGNSKLNDLLAAELINCRDEKVVVAGYSQGALVANMTARNWPNVAALLLVADPARVPNQVGRNYGDALPGFGIWHQALPSWPALPSQLANKVVQLCDRGDVVCDWSRGWGTRGSVVHGSYRTRDRSLLLMMGITGVRTSGYTPVFPR